MARHSRSGCVLRRCRLVRSSVLPDLLLPDLWQAIGPGKAYPRPSKRLRLREEVSGEQLACVSQVRAWHDLLLVAAWGEKPGMNGTPGPDPVCGRELLRECLPQSLNR